MSDNLRDRTAAAIYMQEYPKRCEHCPTPHPSPWAYRVADAVIAELGEAGYAIVNRAESQAAVARLIEEHSR